MSGSPITVLEITSIQDEQMLLRQVFDEVLRPSFVLDELPSFDYFVNGFEEGQVVYVAARGSRILGAGVTGEPSHGVSLLSYLAVIPQERGSGTGGMLLDSMIASWVTRGIGLVLGEIHDPRLHAVSESERPSDRLRFYASHGCELLEVPWVQPALSKQTERVDGMLLIALHREAGFAGGVIPASVILSWAEAYYSSSEGEELDGELPMPLLRRLESRRELAILPLPSFREVPLLDR